MRPFGCLPPVAYLSVRRENLCVFAIYLFGHGYSVPILSNVKGVNCDNASLVFVRSIDTIVTLINFISPNHTQELRFGLFMGNSDAADGTDNHCTS